VKKATVKATLNCVKKAKATATLAARFGLHSREKGKSDGDICGSLRTALWRIKKRRRRHLRLALDCALANKETATATVWRLLQTTLMLHQLNSSCTGWRSKTMALISVTVG
jgi:hypothetical protein